MTPTGTESAEPGAGVTIEGVHAAYGRIEVLHGVDLHVPAGSVFALLGPNGAGKSTLLKVVNGRLRPTAGTVAVDWVTPSSWKPDILARAGIVAIPEGRGVFPNLTVHDNLRMWTYRGGLTDGRGRGAGLRAVPPPEGTPEATGRDALGRRAADVGHLAHVGR